QRSKEDAQDYRYMPDPDIPPIVLGEDEIRAIQESVPRLPASYRQAWQSLSLDPSVVQSLLANPSYALLIATIQEVAGDTLARRVAHWFSSAVSQSQEEEAIIASNFVPEGYIELAQMVEDQELSSTAAKDVFHALLTSELTPRQIAEEKNLLQMSDESALKEIVRAVVDDPASTQSITDIKAGQEKAIGYLVGQVMKRSAGKANPSIAQALIKAELDAR
ncbi:Asp-tRNA(Asn)/Glu-tRNA(Gln) amidotransferase subunit GatB, partial [Candidatus Saccharibacteria bacterium]|nr:Asp-tRNA(Asn)/Glu-tRNA(Gln) amidotransferase subunit GatB [Candidatus Saccharibacteria bacterium]